MTAKPVWSHPVEEAAFKEKNCARCFQADEALLRVSGRGDGCPHLARAATGRLPAVWTKRRNATMGDTYRCSDQLKKPPVNRRASSPTETPVMFDVEPGPLHLVPVDGWPDYRGQAAKDSPEKI